jgi:hypothetical protein
MTREIIDLRKLPRWQQYSIAFSALAVAVTAAWMIGKDQPSPSWLTTKIISVLGWVYIGLFVAVMIAHRVRKKPD